MKSSECVKPEWMKAMCVCVALVEDLIKLPCVKLAQANAKFFVSRILGSD